MKRQTQLRVNISLLRKEADYFIETLCLSNMIKSIVNDERIKERFDELLQLESYPLPKTMSSVEKSKQKPIFDGDFSKFQKAYEDFVIKYVMAMFFEKRVHSPLKSESDIAKQIRSSEGEILERTISIAYAQLLEDIYLDQIQRGYQPFVAL